MEDKVAESRAEHSSEPVSNEVLRDVLGTFCSGVVVVTATGDEPLGLTCQSFASLSLDPALVTFAPARSSRTWPKIRETGAFCVNILASDQPGISDQFARSRAHKFAGVAWSTSRRGAPILDGAIAWIDCTLWAEYDGGDHTIAVGKVHDLAAHRRHEPLLFYRGGYIDNPSTSRQSGRDTCDAAT